MIEISVVVPVYRGREWISDCIESLANQSLALNSFEIIFILNGPDDGTKLFLDAFRHNNKAINIKVLTSKKANAPAARNLGARAAEGRHLTWIDVDDWVSPEYLELLAASAKAGVVPYAQIINVDPAGRQDPLNAINAELFTKTTSLISPSDFVRSMTFMTAKLLPRQWVLDLPLCESLRSGEDVAFYGAVMANYEFQLDLMPAALGAIYYRRVTVSSISRGNSTRDFMVTQRTDVIENLAASLKVANRLNSGAIRQMMRSQASFIRRYLLEHPDSKQDVFDEVVARKIDDFPWENVREVPNKLVVAYNFAPYSDTGAVVTSKRIRSEGASVDVISNNMSRVREKHNDNLLLSLPYVAWREENSTSAFFAGDAAIESFVNSGLDTFKRWTGRGRVYDSIYSRSMWPASHFLAAAIKVKNPQIDWTAEFSDPARITTTGEFRVSPIVSKSLTSQYLGQGPDQYGKLLMKDAEVFRWTELLPYLFADKIVFTNSNQLETMLEYAPIELKSIILSKSIIEKQPTLPRTYYSIETASIETSDDQLNIGYFGDFYNTRGLSEVIDALELLSDEKLSKINFCIFSSSDVSKTKSLSARVRSQISLSKKITYFKFLSSLDNFDYLIVNDAITKGYHGINPYLPSKLSDYRGSSSKIWAIVEPGSPLSQERSDQCSEIGDTDNILKNIENMISEKFPSTAENE